MNKKYMIIGLATSIIVLALGVSLAYWVPRIVGEGAGITLKAANLRIVFTDTDAISASNIEPGWSYTKTFSVKSESDTTYTYDLIIKNLVNTFLTEGFLQYKITSTNGLNMTEYKDIPKSETAANKVIASNITIEPGETQNYTIEFIYKETEEDQSSDMGKTFGGSLFIQEHLQFPKESLGEKLLSDNQTILERIDFSNVFTEENTGTLYKATGNETEDGSDVYYFAGNAQNNWVKFGKDQDSADLYWRIIRTNEDGGVRLLYIGPDPATTSAFIKLDGEYLNAQAFNDYINGGEQSNYMFGAGDGFESARQNTESSTIKQKIDLWYRQTINAKSDTSGNIYDKYVSKTAIYCNDRSGEIDPIYYYSSKFGAYKRLVDAKSPSYKCGNDTNRNLFDNADLADKFSVSSSSGGNGKLTYPIALMTADELVYAGAVYDIVSLTWYYYNSVGESVVGDDRWWTMSPGTMESSDTGLFMDNQGVLYDYDYSNTWTGVRPVLSLKSCVKYVNGDGSSTTPYEVEVDGICALAEN